MLVLSADKSRLLHEVFISEKIIRIAKHLKQLPLSVPLLCKKTLAHTLVSSTHTQKNSTLNTCGNVSLTLAVEILRPKWKESGHETP
jgi:hypothetical protein